MKKKTLTRTIDENDRYETHANDTLLTKRRNDKPHSYKCRELDQEEYKNRHPKVEKAVNWKHCNQLHLEHLDKWYKQNLAAVFDICNHEILQGIHVQTDKLIDELEHI